MRLQVFNVPFSKLISFEKEFDEGLAKIKEVLEK